MNIGQIFFPHKNRFSCDYSISKPWFPVAWPTAMMADSEDLDKRAANSIKDRKWKVIH